MFGAQEIGHDAENFEIEFFNLVAGKNGVGVTLHAGMNFRKREHLGGLLSASRSDCAKQESEREDYQTEGCEKRAGNGLVPTRREHE